MSAVASFHARAMWPYSPASSHARHDTSSPISGRPRQEHPECCARMRPRCRHRPTSRSARYREFAVRVRPFHVVLGPRFYLGEYL